MCFNNVSLKISILNNIIMNFEIISAKLFKKWRKER